MLPIVKRFLSDRGLELSTEKTRITEISEGFDFLGFTLQKRGGKLIIMPSKEACKRFRSHLYETVKEHASNKTEDLLWKLNTKLKGWCNYYRHVCSKATFASLDFMLSASLWRWAKRRHPNKGAAWIKAKYFRRQQNRLRFSTPAKTSKGEIIPFDLYHASKTPIVRHIKIKARATPFDPDYRTYFGNRKLEWMEHENPGESLKEGSSRVRGNSHARFLWEPIAAM